MNLTWNSSATVQKHENKSSRALCMTKDSALFVDDGLHSTWAQRVALQFGNQRCQNDSDKDFYGNGEAVCAFLRATGGAERFFLHGKLYPEIGRIE